MGVWKPSWVKLIAPLGLKGLSWAVAVGTNLLSYQAVPWWPTAGQRLGTCRSLHLWKHQEIRIRHIYNPKSTPNYTPPPFQNTHTHTCTTAMRYKPCCMNVLSSSSRIKWHQPPPPNFFVLMWPTFSLCLLPPSTPTELFFYCDPPFLFAPPPPPPHLFLLWPTFSLWPPPPPPTCFCCDPTFLFATPTPLNCFCVNHDPPFLSMTPPPLPPLTCFCANRDPPFLFADTPHVVESIQAVVGHVKGEHLKMTDGLLLKQTSAEDLHLPGQRLLGTGQRLRGHLHAAWQQELTHQLPTKNRWDTIWMMETMASTVVGQFNENSNWGTYQLGPSMKSVFMLLPLWQSLRSCCLNPAHKDKVCCLLQVLVATPQLLPQPHRFSLSLIHIHPTPHMHPHRNPAKICHFSP